MKKSLVLAVATAASVSAVDAVNRGVGNFVGNGVPNFFTGIGSGSIPGLVTQGSNYVGGITTGTQLGNDFGQLGALPAANINPLLTSGSNTLNGAIKDPLSALTSASTTGVALPGTLIGASGSLIGNGLHAVTNPKEGFDRYAAAGKDYVNSIGDVASNAHTRVGQYASDPSLIATDGAGLASGAYTGVVNAGEGAGAIGLKLGSSLYSAGAAGVTSIPSYVATGTNAVRNPISSLKSVADTTGNVLKTGANSFTDGVEGFPGNIRTALSHEKFQRTMANGGTSIPINIPSAPSAPIAPNGALPPNAPIAPNGALPPQEPHLARAIGTTLSDVNAAIPEQFRIITDVQQPPQPLQPLQPVQPHEITPTSDPIVPSLMTSNNDGSITASCLSGYSMCNVQVPEGPLVICYNPATFTCVGITNVNGSSHNVLCPSTAPSTCGANCYNTSHFKCVDGILTQI